MKLKLHEFIDYICFWRTSINYMLEKECDIVLRRINAMTAKNPESIIKGIGNNDIISDEDLKKLPDYPNSAWKMLSILLNDGYIYLSYNDKEDIVWNMGNDIR